MAMSVWTTLLMASLALGAPEAGDEPSPDATQRDASAHREVLTMAVELKESGEEDSAHASLGWLLEQPLEPSLRTEVEALQATLPRRRRDVMPALRLAAWQTALGSYLLGPHMARMTYDPLRSPTPYFVGAAGGALVGTGSAIAMAVGPGLDHGQANAIIASQQLGGWNGGAIAWLVAEDEVNSSIGLMAGVGAGTVGGYLLTLADPRPGTVLGAHSGAVWGLAFGLAGAEMLELWDTDQQLRAMLIWSDIGTLGGLLLAHRMDLSRAQVWALNLGGVAGLATTVQVMALVAASGNYEDQTAIGIGMAGTLLGGGVGLWLAARSDRDEDRGITANALISGTDDEIRLGLPLPIPIPSDDGAAYGLPLVAYRF